MKSRYFIYAGIAITVALIISGCAQSRLAADYGTSYKLQKIGQTLNPKAENNLEPVYGFEGQAAERTITKYEKSFEKPAPATVYNFNVSTGGK